MYQFKAIFSSISGSAGSFTTFWNYLVNNNIPFHIHDIERYNASQNLETGSFSIQSIMTFICYANTIEELQKILSDNPSLGYVAVVFRSLNRQKYYDIPFEFLT